MHLFWRFLYKKNTGKTLTDGVPRGSVLDPLLFLIHINDLNHVIKHSSMHHFADDTNPLYSNSSLKLINKQIKHDLKLIVHWLRTTEYHWTLIKLTLFFFDKKIKKLRKVKLPYKWSENNSDNSFQILRYSPRSTFVMGSTFENAETKTR